MGNACSRPAAIAHRQIIVRGLFLAATLCNSFTSSPRAKAAEAANAVAGPHGTLELIAEQRSIAPGRTFWVGLHFRLEPGWHIYWMNPGDSGEPPKIDWQLPGGFRAGAVRWPVPERLEHQSIVDYAYEREVLLMIPIQPPSHTARASLSIGGAVTWLVCREMCIPAKADVRLSLPVHNQAPRPDPRWRQLFQRARSRLPKPLPASRTTAIIEEHQFLLSVKTGSAMPGAIFFPITPMQIENAAAQSVSPTPEGIRLTLKRSEQLVKPITSLKGVLVLASNRAFLINAPVTASKTSQRRNER